MSKEHDGRRPHDPDTAGPARPSRPIAVVEHSPTGDLTISIEGVGSAVAATYADLPSAVEQLRTRITAAYDHDTVTIVFRHGNDPIGRHGNQRFVAASSWPTAVGHELPNPEDPWDIEYDRDVLVTTFDDGEVGVHVIRKYGDGPGHQVVRVDPAQGGWIADLLDVHPQAHVEMTKSGLRMVDSADWRAAILHRLARSWAAHPDMRLGDLLLTALEFAVGDPTLHATDGYDDLVSLLGDIQDDDLGAALDRYVSVQEPHD